jgi:mucin-19
MVIRALVILAVIAASQVTPTTETFFAADHPAGEQFEWTVPDGVTSVTVEAAGGNGARVDKRRSGGRGAVVTVDVAVKPGQTLQITLGADGRYSGKGGAGYGAGGTGIAGGGGGGSTAVLLGDTVVAIAGGGGGASTGNGATSGTGGNGGTPKGKDGAVAGGSGGANGTGGDGVGPWGRPGGDGRLGSGGDVANETGGGGGAGFGGGGAGGIGGDGGGGGSTGADKARYSARSDSIDDGWVTITYTAEKATPAATPTQSSQPPLATRPDYAPIGIGAAVVVVAGIALMVVGRMRRRR